MSLKKTWFSYILWLAATGFSILFIYHTVSVLGTCFCIYGSGQPGFMAGYTAIVIAAVMLLALLLHLLCRKIPVFIKNKWVLRILHILVFIAITSLFVYTRFEQFINGGITAEQAVCFFELTRVGSGAEERWALEYVYPQVSLSVSMWEGIYMRFLSALFLFLGNHPPILLLIQHIFQILSLFCLYLIGRHLKKGFAGWLPAFFYTVSPICISMVSNVGPSNFWILLSLAGMAVLFGLQKGITGLRKKKHISYILSAVWGTAVCVFVFAAKSELLLHNGPTFLVPAEWNMLPQVLYAELFLWAALLLLSCITFWFSENDSISFHIIPLTASVGLIFALWQSEKEIVFFLLLYGIFWLFLIGTEGITMLFSKKPEGKPADLLQAEPGSKQVSSPATEFLSKEFLKEKDTANESLSNEKQNLEDTSVIRVSDILKKTAKETDCKEETLPVNEKASADLKTIPETDKTAMIENVLPMPKKHVSRSFEYAFEPPKDKMHYDIEVENDDYDYR